MSNLINDIKYAARQLRKSPGFTAIAVISLALGIGAGTAVFSLVNAILLRSLPVPNPHELRVLQWTGTDNKIPSFNGNSIKSGNCWTGDYVSHPVFLSLREQGAAQADIFGFAPLQDVTNRARGDAFSANGMMVSDNFFSGLGVRPFIGRLLNAEEDYTGAATSVVITYDCWERHFALDPGVLGQGITLNGTSFTVVGVVPQGFSGVRPGDPSEFYVPMAAQSQFLYTSITATHHWFVRLMARLRPGVSDAQLRATLDVVFAPEADVVMNEPKMLVEPGRGGLAIDRNNYRKPLLLMLGVVGVVMLVACANLAGLSLARGATRQHERAVRAALGACRWRLVRQSLTESLVLALLGGGLGVLLAIWGRSAISRLLAGSADGLYYDLSLDLTVLGFSLVTTLVTALLLGLLPALRAGRVDPLGGLKSRGALGVPRLRAGRILVAAQICLSLLLLTGAGLYVRTLVNLVHIDVGFSTGKLLLFQLNTSGAGYSGVQRAAFYDRVQASLATIPGVRGATFFPYPLLGNRREMGSGGITFPNSPVSMPQNIPISRLTVGETFFTTMGIPVLHGRGFGATDTADAPKVVVINEIFAREYLPNIDPIGLTVNMMDADWQIIGVCRDAKYHNIKEAVPPTMYFLLRQRFYGPVLYEQFQNLFFPSVYFAVRTALPPLAVATVARKAVAAIDPGVPVANITTQEAVRNRSISQERLFATLCGALAVLALLLACIGLYGLMAYNVARRTSEIGIRMALGATRRNVAGSILREALLLGGIGVAVGVPVALALSRLIKSQLYDVEPNDPFTLVAVVLLLLLVAVGSAWIPARRAAKTDPMEALRYE